eukprot:UN21476
MLSYNELWCFCSGSFHFSKNSLESYRYPLLQKPKKRDKGVSVAKAWDVFIKSHHSKNYHQLKDKADFYENIAFFF